MDILDWVEERFGKAPTTDKLQQVFYLSGQEKMEKVQQFASHLEQIYRKLQAKFPGGYDRKQLKDKLFFGMHQHLYVSMHFLYKQEEMNMKICYLPPMRQKQSGQKVRSELRLKV